MSDSESSPDETTVLLSEDTVLDIGDEASLDVAWARIDEGEFQ